MSQSSIPVLVAAAVAACCVSPALLASDPQPPSVGEGESLPKHMTQAERDWLDANPFVVRMTPPSLPPTGPLVCPGEYEPASGIIFSYQGSSVQSIVRQMVRHVTTTGNAKAYINHTASWSASQKQNLLNQLAAEGANISRVELVPYTTNAVWIRDYGPRYVFEGDVRVIADHDYNVTPRTLDNAQPANFSQYKRHARYHSGLLHGGGNYHLDSTGRGHATRLITNENPALTEATVKQRFQNYWGVETTLYTPFRTSIDGTQHIDMWMQVIDDDKVVISQWPNNPTLQEALICDAAAASLAAAGYQVFRTPAFSIFDSIWGNVHYTYTNVVMCNDVVMIPYFDRVASLVPQNAVALAAWQAALPDKTIVQIDSDALVILSGVMHCIVMHMPVHRGAPGPNGGLSPTALVRTPVAGQVVTPGVSTVFRWIADDDVAVTSFDVRVSGDGGQTFPLSLATGATAAATFDSSNGSFRVTMPLPAGTYFTDTAVMRVVARDADGNEGHADSGVFTINGPVCIADYDRSFSVDLTDLLAFLSEWSPLLGSQVDEAKCDLNNDGVIDLVDLLDFLSVWLVGCN
ncbi:MAG: agmatine deiminase family protein [Phycisphaeraceae bacterium]|nr:agmatine deiminase family protein [Phycisphaeraceae bacterium]